MNGRHHPIDQVKLALAGYAFKTRPLQFDPQRRAAVGPAPDLEERPVWAYRSYDCLSADPGDLTDRDLLVVNGLNAGLNSAAFLSLKVVAPIVSEALRAVTDDLTYWELSEADLTVKPEEGSPAWSLWRAWWLMTGVPDVGPAITYKLLHHKNPRYFPLLDNQTLGALPKGESWVTIHRDLNESADEYASLEAWFAQLASERGGVALTRLRIHDIVLWCGVDGDRWDTVLRHGEDVLAG